MSENITNKALLEIYRQIKQQNKKLDQMAENMDYLLELSNLQVEVQTSILKEVKR